MHAANIEGSEADVEVSVDHAFITNNCSRTYPASAYMPVSHSKGTSLIVPSHCLGTVSVEWKYWTMEWQV